MIERRQIPRWELKKEVKSWIPLLLGFDQCIIEDIHLKGMCVSFDKRLPYEKSIRLSFTLEENYDFIKVEAQIAWSRENNGRHIYGLSFSKVEDEDKDRIYHYINNNCYDQFKNRWWGRA